MVVWASMNIKEVAARARLSTATVSRTINQSGLVRPRTAEKVKRAICDLGYIPNTQARALVSGRSQMFGLIISDIVNPFFPELVKSFEFAAIHRGYEVIVANTDYNSERMGGCVRRMIERKVDGVAIMTSADELADCWAGAFDSTVIRRSDLLIRWKNGDEHGKCNRLHLK